MNEGEADAITDEEPKLRLYELLHRQVEHERRWRLVRTGGGMALIGAVFGYAVLFDRLRFLSVTPVLYGVVMMAALRSSVEILYLHRHMVRIEGALRDREPLFRWVTDYGTFGDGQSLCVWDVDVNLVPRTALVTLIGAIYFVLVGVSLATWEPLPGEAAGVRITTELLVLNYVVFTVTFAAIAAVGYLHFQRLQAEVDGER